MGKRRVTTGEPHAESGAQALEAQERSLLDVVDLYRRRRCEEVLGAAQEQAARLVRQAYREARERLHAAVVEERRRGRDETAAVLAQSQTQRRERRQRATAALLQLGWRRLREELQRCWQAPSRREVWVEGALRQALTVLPHARWRVSHPPDWPDAECERAAAWLAARMQDAVELHADAALSAGLRICAGGGCLDASADGLVADRRLIEARLLDLLQVDGS